MQTSKCISKIVITPHHKVLLTLVLYCRFYILTCKRSLKCSFRLVSFLKCSANLKRIWGRQICQQSLISCIISYLESYKKSDVGWKSGINQTVEWSLSLSHVKSWHVWPSLSLAVFAARWQHIISGAFVSRQSYEYSQCFIYTNSLNNVGTSSFVPQLSLSSHSLSFFVRLLFSNGVWQSVSSLF